MDVLLQQQFLLLALLFLYQLLFSAVAIYYSRDIYSLVFASYTYIKTKAYAFFEARVDEDTDINHAQDDAHLTDSLGQNIDKDAGDL
jgi:hypothetical protein